MSGTRGKGRGEQGNPESRRAGRTAAPGRVPSRSGQARWEG